MERDTIIVRFIPADKWYHSAMWELMDGYESVNGEVHVPEGFKTDGATIPLLLRWIFSPTGKYFGAAIVHDYILVKEWDWPKANDEFDKEMTALGVGRFRKFLILNAVRAWGWFKVNILRKKHAKLYDLNKHLL